jgi:hypothetical protein
MEMYGCRSIAEDDFNNGAEMVLQISAENEEEISYNFDNREFGNYKRFAGIRMRTGCVVDAVQFVYNDDKNTRWYGGPGGNLQEFFFQDGEFVTRIDWTTGMWEDYPLPVVACITFCTNKGRKFTGGSADSCKDTKSYTIQAKEGKYYHSARGKYGRYLLDFDTFYYRPMNLVRFDDTLYVQSRERVKEVRINTGWVVDGIQFVYDDDEEASYHGGPGGSQKTLRLQEDEHICRISGKVGKYLYQEGETLCHIEIFTDKGNSVSGGTMQGCWNTKEFCLKAEDGEQIFALTGEHLEYMRQLDVGMYTLTDIAFDSEEDGQGLMVSGIDAHMSGKLLSQQGLEGDSLSNVVFCGCFERNTLKEMLNKTIEATEPDGKCRKCLIMRGHEITESFLTEGYVNTPQYIFRSPLGGELAYNQENRKLRSKYMKNNVNYKPVINLESQNAEQYEYATILRILATKSSSDPLSQFVSVALDFKTAKDFGNGKLVLAYKLIPNSPLLGLRKDGQLGGEDQFQVLGGTEIIELYKFSDHHWEQYDYDAGTWKRCKTPVNKEYERLKSIEL